ncbi:efflux RND transporter periplasmic adaptor subunit [Pseudomonadota bacterium]
MMMNKTMVSMLFQLALALMLAMGGVSAGEQDSPSVLVETALVKTQVATQALTAYGVLEPDPDQIVSLSLPHAGLINRVWVRLGQRVKSGDQLLEVITAPDARMQYLQAQSLVDYARRELERQQRLQSEQLATTSQVDAANKSLVDAQAALKALQLRGMDKAEVTLRAPMDGVITRLDVSQGQRVQADTTALLIAAEQRLIARLGVEPEDLANVEVGSPVTLTSVFVPDVRIDTTVREVHAMIDPATQLVEVLAEIPADRTEQLVLGSRIAGRIQLQSAPAVVVPRSAVLGEPGDRYVFTVSENRARRVAVQTGTEAADFIAVEGALQPGDTVVVTGNYELQDGMAVRMAP